MNKIILNKFLVYTRGNTEMGLLSARRRIKFTFFFFFFFFFFLSPPHICMACNSCQNEKRLHCVYICILLYYFFIFLFFIQG